MSRDNPTGTGRNLARFLGRAGIERRHTIVWNAVPWIIHAVDARNRAPRSAEIAAGLKLLPELLPLLPNLRVAVLSGRVAQRAEPLLREARPGLAVLTMPHPSPVYVNTSPTIAARIAATLAEAAALCREDEGD